MNRKKFIKTCGYTCLGTTAGGILLQSCVATKSISVAIVDENIVVPKADFQKEKGYLNYLIVRNDKLQFPIYVFRFSEAEYTALYLQCSHQGNELNAYGDKLVCSAHGSEFDNKGRVTNGPATESIKSFPIHFDNHNILISIKKI